MDNKDYDKKVIGYEITENGTIYTFEDGTEKTLEEILAIGYHNHETLN
jgi:hypothetical protein